MILGSQLKEPSQGIGRTPQITLAMVHIGKHSPRTEVIRSPAAFRLSFARGQQNITLNKRSDTRFEGAIRISRRLAHRSSQFGGIRKTPSNARRQFQDDIVR